MTDPQRPTAEDIERCAAMLREYVDKSGLLGPIDEAFLRMESLARLIDWAKRGA